MRMKPGKPCYLIDIDGTVADCNHRRVHLAKTPKDWKAFNAAMVDDTAFSHMRTLLNDLSLSNHSYIVYMSGRDESMRELTFDWLVKQGFPPAYNMYMRADGDYRDDSIIKFELLQRVMDDGFIPIMAFDDRNRVVEMWRLIGIPCAQVAEGDF